MEKIQFGIEVDIPNFEYARKVTFESEALGFDSVWIYDHFFWEGDRDAETEQVSDLLECTTVMSALAALTRRVRIGSLVMCNSYRSPSLTAKIAATLDVISNGRLEFAIGAGWKENEYTAYGYSFPKPAVRIAQLREAVIIIKKMWTEEKPSFTGKYYEIKDALCEPKPIQKPYPPIWIGGGGERLLLKVVAELADGWNWYGSPKECAHKLDVLRGHCANVGRDFDEIKKSWTGELFLLPKGSKVRSEVEEYLSSKEEPPIWDTDSKEIQKLEARDLDTYVSRNIVGTPDDCCSKIEEYLKLGVTRFYLEGTTTKSRGQFAKEIMPKFQAT
ncbi:MAG: TIGR03560 family F420-dependent LLM class oxidoreductase [Candidatus Bathyarchaeota archaeon]|nr:MAG: TIGR03560 family F420-dependent LLM class oxidoreductase [Candidatus Bathyarchaeota archaeon]